MIKLLKYNICVISCLTVLALIMSACGNPNISPEQSLSDDITNGEAVSETETVQITEAELLSDLIPEKAEWDVGTMNEITDKNLNTEPSQLPVYSFSLLSNFVGARGVVVNTSIIGTTLYWFNSVAKMTVNHIIEIDDDRIAVLYKTAEDNLDEAYVLVVFERTVCESPKYESWSKTGEAYFIGEVKSSENYSDIKVGDKVEALYEIDKSIYYDVLRDELSSNLTLEWYKENISNPDLSDAPRMVFKLLEDGILTFEYNKKEMIITEKSFYSYDGELPMGVSVTTPTVLDVLK